jgi:uncharacterized protein associated with vWA-MoxR-VMAP ternary system
LVPHQDFRCHPCPPTKMLPMSPDRTLRVANIELVGPIISRLFLTALGPWISHTARAVTDLRYEFPVLRPSTGEYSAYAPDKITETELRRLATGHVADDLAIKLHWEPRMLEALTRPSDVTSTLALAAANGRSPVNPLWLAAQLGEILPFDPDVAALLFNAPFALSTANVLRCICHGDLHGENILVLGDDRHPTISVIDFEATHEGHICKDFARLESALLTRIFEWDENEANAVVTWFGETMVGSVLSPKTPLAGTDNLARAAQAVGTLRQVLSGCGQGHWPIAAKEYQLAMFASLLPFVRYPDIPPLNRKVALALAAGAATALLSSAGARSASPGLVAR